jgi:hypothetical protein
MGPGLGHRLQLGLEYVPRLAGSAWPGRLGPMGPAAGMGAAAAAPTAVGARGPVDVEPNAQQLGIMEQRGLGFGLAVVVGGPA